MIIIARTRIHSQLHNSIDRECGKVAGVEADALGGKPYSMSHYAKIVTFKIKLVMTLSMQPRIHTETTVTELGLPIGVSPLAASAAATFAKAECASNSAYQSLRPSDNANKNEIQSCKMSRTPGFMLPKSDTEHHATMC